MITPLRRSWTRDDFFAWAAAQEGHYEFEAWRATTLTTSDLLGMPEIGIEVPVNELYEDVNFPDEAASGV